MFLFSVFMFDESNKRETFYHAVLLETKKLKTSFSGDNELRKRLQELGSFEAIFNKEMGVSNVEEFVKSDAKLEKIAKDIQDADFDFQVLTINDPAYPLKDVPDATPVLYARGDLCLFGQKSIAVVGTRKLFKNNMVCAALEGSSILERLVRAGHVIVSGLAEGCDTLAHEAAILYGRRTVAVLGTPLDIYYPQMNRSLQEEIARNHLLVSQYPIGKNTFGSFFAHRNHTTVSLSSEGVVVVHADDKSGTQHAIRACKKQGKPLYILQNNFSCGYAWPGKVKKKYSNAKVVSPNRNNNGADK
ncbi:DNA processing protein DprA [Candidatus Woesearchaeota archaeon]|nr:DNA processing protein DprA [Candidatus Woesearchaeota archaeon]